MVAGQMQQSIPGGQSQQGFIGKNVLSHFLIYNHHWISKEVYYVAKNFITMNIKN